jgi:CheY-like chemotaxis protein
LGVSESQVLSVLVVEDEALISLELADMIEDLGHRVIGPAASVSKALELLQALPRSPDVAIVDANLGGQPAKPVVEVLHALGTPVVIASGYTRDELAKLGFDDMLMRKPYSQTDLQRVFDLVTNVRCER